MSQSMRVAVVAAVWVAVAVLVTGVVSAEAGEAGAAERWDQADFKEVHPMIARLALALMSPKGQAAAMKLVRDLPAEAGWADRITFTEPKQLWSSGFHYINLVDGSCSYDYARDCKDKTGVVGVCAHGAIANYTKRLADVKLPAEQRAEALKFLVHLVGDIHQPLHVANTGDWGGNKITGSLMGGPQTNAHALWDAGLLARHIADKYANDVKKYSSTLLTRLRTGDFRTSVSGWKKCRNARALYGQCASEWANESARLACDVAYVAADGHTKLAIGFNLDATYLARAFPVIEKQIARAAARLSGLLDAIFQATARAEAAVRPPRLPVKKPTAAPKPKPTAQKPLKP
jgi:hypothetical protein